MFNSSSEMVNEKNVLEQLIQNIVIAVSPDKIFCKGNFLLIVISNNSQKSFSEIKTLIEATGILPLFHYVICNSSVLENDLNHGHLFYSTLCTKENQAYDSGNSTLPLPLIQRAQKIRENSTHEFMTGYQRAQSFLKGAGFYIANEDPGMAAFMLHQSAEQGLRALLLVLTGQDVKSHSLTELNQHLKKYGQEVTALFQSKTGREQYLSDRLEKAYVCARYTNCYQISQDDLYQLHSQVKTLLGELKHLFEELLNRFTHPGTNYFLPLNLAL